MNNKNTGWFDYLRWENKTGELEVSEKICDSHKNAGRWWKLLVLQRICCLASRCVLSPVLGTLWLFTASPKQIWTLQCSPSRNWFPFAIHDSLPQSIILSEPVKSYRITNSPDSLKSQICSYCFCLFLNVLSYWCWTKLNLFLLRAKTCTETVTHLKPVKPCAPY